MIRISSAWLTGAAIALVAVDPAGADDRSIDGSGNSSGDRGAANTPFLRVAGADYADGLSSLAGPARPNARDISRLICDQQASEPNGRRGSDYLWQWGQFLDHDITLSPANSGEDASIAITDPGDILYNPHFPFIPLERTGYVVDGSGIRQQVNAITSFIDASQVYGSDPATAAALRTFSGGRLLTGPDGLLPFNTVPLPMDGAGRTPGVALEDLRMAGDVRANEQSGLTAMHTLFLQEHNRLAAELEAAHPTWNDEQIYQRARKIVGALIQSITYNEWLPALLGPHAPDPAGFTHTPAVDPGISNEFATALFRFGHSMVSPKLMRIRGDDLPDAPAEIDLATAFFNPDSIESPAAYEFILKGLACQLHQDVDARIIPELRETLFGPAGSGGMDLGALNIQRGRDHGLPDYNSVRASYGLAPVTAWPELSSDSLVQADFAATYSSVNDLDLWIAALSEDRLPGAAVGETIAVAIAAELNRLAEGDAFFYLWDDDLSPALRDEITLTRLSDLIERNTSLRLQENVFFIPNPELAFHRIHKIPGVGIRLSFLADPGHEYQIRYGSSPATLMHDLLPEPVNSGDAAYMLEALDDSEAGGVRFYQLLRTPRAN